MMDWARWLEPMLVALIVIVAYAVFVYWAEMIRPSMSKRAKEDVDDLIERVNELEENLDSLKEVLNKRIEQIRSTSALQNEFRKFREETAQDLQTLQIEIRDRTSKQSKVQSELALFLNRLFSERAVALVMNEDKWLPPEKKPIKPTIEE
jgi:vacuolar-type H+-ATPase subunit I/STV1